MIRLTLTTICLFFGLLQVNVYASCSVPMGDWDYCALCGPCDSGEGDCDSDDECQTGLICHKDIGDQAPYYLRKGVDICIGSEDDNEADDEDDEDDRDNPDDDTDETDDDDDDNNFVGDDPVDNPDNSDDSDDEDSDDVPEACSDNWYAVMHQSECNPQDDSSDTQDNPGETTCKFSVGSSSYCWSCGPCDVGEGICNTNDQCKDDLVCVSGYCQYPDEN